ncbi:MAG: hypothetical protein GC151_14000 [Betaproteobacteria bacterium]|nr:hypothetical protein [Betaproteobacteria bacterium]
MTPENQRSSRPTDSNPAARQPNGRDVIRALAAGIGWREALVALLDFALEELVPDDSMLERAPFERRGPAMPPRRSGNLSACERDPRIAEFITLAHPNSTLEDIRQGLFDLVGAEHTPSRSSIHRYRTRVNRANASRGGSRT